MTIKVNQATISPPSQNYRQYNPSQESSPGVARSPKPRHDTQDTGFDLDVGTPNDDYQAYDEQPSRSDEFEHGAGEMFEHANHPEPDGAIGEPEVVANTEPENLGSEFSGMLEGL